MTKFTRDRLIEKIESTPADRVILFPTSDLIGERTYLETSRESLVALIRRKFKENVETGMKYRIDTKGKRAFIEAAQRAANILGNATDNTKKATEEAVAPKTSRGRKKAEQPVAREAEAAPKRRGGRKPAAAAA